MFDRFARSWDLVKASGAVLAADKELLLLPVLAALAGLLVIASFAFPVFIDGWLQQAGGSADGSADPMLMIWTFAFYVALYFVGFFFNAALVGAALERLKGGDPTLGSALAAASSRIGTILGYALIAATVGLVLRAIEERVGWVGRIVVSLIGTAWTVATFLAVPVLVAQDVGPFEAVTESAKLLRKTWGENLIGSVGLGFAFGMAYFLLVLATVFLCVLLSALGPAAVGLVVVAGVVAALSLLAMHSALQAIYSAALYQYAAGGEVHPAFAAGLEKAFQPKLVS